MKPYYTTPELIAGDAPVTAKLGVIGHPIAHSLSPGMQQAALHADGRALTYIRILCELGPGHFPELISQLQRLDFLGANVTVPFKKEAYALADEADALSSLCGAANTLVFREGKISCFNTDGPGFERAIAELTGRALSDLSIILLGACGGAGSALAAQCVLSGSPSLTLVNRPKPELTALADSLRPHAPGCEIQCLAFSSPELRDAVRQADLIVNATSLGLAAGDATPIDPAWLHAEQAVYDIITHPTPLCRAAQARGCTASTGQSMLLWQGALAYERWFHHVPDIELMRSALTGGAASHREP